MNTDEELERIKQAVIADLSTAMKVLSTLTPREEKVLRMRLGLWSSGVKKPSEIAEEFGGTLSYQQILAIERRAAKKIRHTLRCRQLIGVLLAPSIELSQPLESIKRVCPELMRHLMREHHDITKVSARVFEEIVAELLAGMGWREVKLVGRSSETSADIFAGHFLPDGITPIRVFIEAKRWKDRIGVEIFNQVLGAMVSERERLGWHQAWIIALGGAADTRKFSRDEWRAKGLEVKDRSDLNRWLDSYRPSREGLWLPPDVLKGRV